MWHSAVEFAKTTLDVSQDVMSFKVGHNSDVDSMITKCTWLSHEACPNSQGARFLKIDLAQLSSQKRFDFRNS